MKKLSTFLLLASVCLAQSTIGGPGNGSAHMGRGGIAGNTIFKHFSPLGSQENIECLSNYDASCWTGVQMDGPAMLPQAGMYTGMDGTPAPGSYIDVTSSATLTSALSSVTCGQHIRLHVANGPYPGFTLPAKNCDSGHWIWIESDQDGAPGFPPEHTMLTPCQSNQASVPFYPQYNCPTPAQLTAQIECTGTSCIKIAAGANYYRFIGLDIWCNPTAPNDIVGGCVDFTNGGGHFILDRSLIHGQAIACSANPTTGAETCTSRDVDKGISSSSSNHVAFINGWIYDILNPQGSTTDTNGFGFGGNGGVSGAEDVRKIYNALIASAGEAWLSGGGGQGSGQITYTPNDYTIRDVRVFKPASWLLCTNSSTSGCHDPNDHNHPLLKNNGELKNANRVLIEGIDCENSWMGWQTDQSGFCLLLTPKNQSNKTVVTSSSDSTGTILTGTFPSDVVGPTCATPGHCMVTFNGVKTQAQTWSNASITVSPAVTANLSNVAALACNPGLNPTATATNITMRYIDIRNSKNGISFAAALSDCGDFSAGVNAVSIHDVEEQGVNWILSNLDPAQTGFGQQCIDIVNSETGSAAIQNFDIEHMTCAMAQGYPSGGFSGLDFTLDETDTTGQGSQDIVNRIQRNNIGPMGGLTGFHLGTLYQNGLNNGIVRESGSSWIYTRNVLGTGVWPGQNSAIPLPPSDADSGDTPAGSGCNSSGASCHPNGSAFTNLFISYNGPNGQPGYLGNYQLNCPGGPYCNAATDGGPIGVNYTAFNAAMANVFTAPISYTPAEITTTVLTPATSGVAYQQLLSANSAGPMQQWSITSGSLPTGITLGLCGASWCLAGNSTAVGSYPLTFQMMDAAQQYDTANLTLAVNSGSPSGSPNWQLAFTNPAGFSEENDFAIRHSNNEWYIADRVSGFWESKDQGTTWTQINGTIPIGGNIQGWTIQVDQISGYLIAATLDAGTNSNDHWYYSNNDGSAWTQIAPSGGFHTSRSPELSGCIMPPSSGANMVCGGFFGSPNTSEFYSANDGATAAVGTYTPGVSSVLGLAYNPSDQSYWTGTENNGVFRSTDQGLTWTQVWTYQTSPSNGDVYFLTFDGSGNPVLSAQGGTWRGVGTGNGPYTWTDTFPGTQQGRGIFTDSLGSIYWSHRIDSNYPNSLYRSLDGGQTWNPWDTNLTQELEVFHMEENPADGKIYIVIENGTSDAANVYSTPK